MLELVCCAFCLQSLRCFVPPVPWFAGPPARCCCVVSAESVDAVHSPLDRSSAEQNSSPTAMDARPPDGDGRLAPTAAPTAGFGLATSQAMDVPPTKPRARIRAPISHATPQAHSNAAPEADPTVAQAAVTAPAFYSGFILAPDSLHSHASFSRLTAMPLPTDSIVPVAPAAAAGQPPPESVSSNSSFAGAAVFSTDPVPPLAVIPRPTSCRVELLEDDDSDEVESASYKAVARLPPHLQPRANAASQRVTCCGKYIGRSPGVALRCITREEAAQLDQASTSRSASPLARASGRGGQSPTSPASAGFGLEFDL